jgi:hypothetical protein
MPWKCVFTDLKTGNTFTRYYTREGIEKARGTATSESFVAMNQGPDMKDYYETYRKYKSGEIKLVRNWYLYGADYPKRSNPMRYRYDPNKNDKRGNWLVAKVDFRDEGMSREIYYYDEKGYDAEEDTAIDKRISELVANVKDKENPFNIDNIVASVFAFAVKSIYIFGLFVLFMLIFKRRSFYLWFDKKATYKITPWGNGLFNRTIIAGLFPICAAMAPVGYYLYTGHTTAVITNSLVMQTLIGLAVALLYCIAYILIRGALYSRKRARWELAYSISICICIWAGIILSIYIVVISLIVLLFVGMLFGRSNDSPSDDNTPDAMHVTSWDGEGQYLQRLSDNYYIDNNGNMYSVSGGSAHRLSDWKNFN